MLSALPIDQDGISVGTVEMTSPPFSSSLLHSFSPPNVRASRERETAAQSEGSRGKGGGICGDAVREGKQLLRGEGEDAIYGIKIH